MLFLLVSCAVSEEESLAGQIESTIDELNELTAQIDEALIKDNIGDARELVPQYAAKAKEYEALADQYVEISKSSKDPVVKAELDMIKQNRITIRENVEEWVNTLQAYDDLVTVLNAILILTED